MVHLGIFGYSCTLLDTGLSWGAESGGGVCAVKGAASLLHAWSELWQIVNGFGRDSEQESRDM